MTAAAADPNTTFSLEADLPLAEILDAPEAFLQPQRVSSDVLLASLRRLYACTVAHCPSCTFRDLYIESFDMEQIWAVLCHTNDEIVADVQCKMAQLNAKFDHLSDEALPGPDSEDDYISQENSDNQEAYSEAENSQSEEENSQSEQENSQSEEEEEENSQLEEEDAEDDDFDLYEDAEDDLDARKIRYDDFFDEKTSKDAQQNSDEDDEENDEDSPAKRPKKNLNLGSDDEEEEDFALGSNGKKPAERLSTFEKAQEKLQREIAQLEMENVAAQKPWTLAGEVNARARPVNSLLDVDVEFESGLKPVPVVTQETTQTLESLIVQRIKDRVFDDVERRFRTDASDETGAAAAADLDFEKSKSSLASIYEQEAVVRAERTAAAAASTAADSAAVSRLTPEQAEIAQAFAQLMRKLDALSNFHFTPKAPPSDVKIASGARSSIPAALIEEATPSSIAAVDTLAPHEIHAGSQPIGPDEQNKKRARRLAKAAAAARHAASSKVALSRKQQKALALKKLARNKNVTIAKKK